MPEPRFFVSAESVDRVAGKVVITDAGIVDQLRKVLRLGAGDRVGLLDGQGNIFHCALGPASRGGIEATILRTERALGEPGIHVEVALPILRGDRFEWAVQKLTELGASRVVPLVSERTVVRMKSESRLARWQAIAREAAEQCERGAVPPVVMPADLHDYWRSRQRVDSTSLNIVCAERVDTLSLESLLHSDKITDSPPTDISVTVGPEGGFTDAEVKLASELGFTLVSMGPRILRAETAAVAAACQIIAALGDTGGSVGSPEGA